MTIWNWNLALHRRKPLAGWTQDGEAEPHWSLRARKTSHTGRSFCWEAAVKTPQNRSQHFPGKLDPGFSQTFPFRCVTLWLSFERAFHYVCFRQMEILIKGEAGSQWVRQEIHLSGALQNTVVWWESNKENTWDEFRSPVVKSYTASVCISRLMGTGNMLFFFIFIFLVINKTKLLSHKSIYNTHVTDPPPPQHLFLSCPPVLVYFAYINRRLSIAKYKI